jgi:CSLREA domain-containing protein
MQKHHTWNTAVFKVAGFLFLGLLIFNSISVRPVYADNFLVTKTADTNDGVCDDDCSLREAIGAANASPGADIITFDPSLNGTPITLSIPGTGEDANATGDLDITDDLTINGNGTTNTIMSGGGIDRVFNIRGGAIVEFNFITVQNGNINNRGGGIWVESSTLTLNDSLVRNNTSTSGPSGGGLFNTTGTVTINRSVFTGNTGTGGGAISQETNATMTIRDTTISGNTSTARGGGITNFTTGTMVIVNSTISGNTASTNGGGVAKNATLTIYNSTIANNTTNGNGGGFDNNISGTVTVVNTIVANNTDANGGQSPDCNGAITANYSLIESNLLCTITGSNNIVGSDPQLGPLADNGGPNQTHALQLSSPARDAADNAVCTAAPVNSVDQRGVPRPQGVACDIGAYEEEVAVVIPGPNGGDGPGGVGVTDGSSTLELWLRADKGVFSDTSCTSTTADGGTVGCWQDRSGNGHNATLGTVGQQPIFRANRRNSVYNLPALEFDGSNDRLATLPLQLHATGSSGLSIFSVFDTDTDTSQRFLVAKGISAQCTDELELGVRAGSTPNGAYGFHRGCGRSTYAAGGTIAINTYYLMSALALPVGNTPNNVNIFRDGSALALADNNTGWVNAGAYSTAVEQLNIGTRQDTNATTYSAYHDGDATEIIIFTTDLNSIQRILVENYLSAKYEIDISGSGNDHYDGDGNTTGNGDFDLDVAGIGQFGGNQHTQAHGAGMIMVNGSFLNDDGDWLLFGHNTAVNVKSSADLPTTGDWSSAASPMRWARHWYIDVTDAVGTTGGAVDIVFDFSEAGMNGGQPPSDPASNYRLLKRDNPTGQFADIATATAVVGDQVHFQNIDVSLLGSNFTLGTLDDESSPTAVTLSSLSATNQSASLTTLILSALALAWGTVWLRRRAR